MKKSKRFFLPVDDCDISLINIQMDKSLNSIDPSDIVGRDVKEISQMVSDEHRRVLLATLKK